MSNDEALFRDRVLARYAYGRIGNAMTEWQRGCYLAIAAS